MTLCKPVIDGGSSGEACWANQIHSKMLLINPFTWEKQFDLLH